MPAERNDAVELLRQGLAGLIGHESTLLAVPGVSERAIVSQLARHLAGCVGGRGDAWDVDVEYNRRGAVSKAATLCGCRSPRRSEDRRSSGVTATTAKRLIVPDLIVHRRGPDGPNFLAVEVKRGQSQRRPIDSSRCVQHKGRTHDSDDSWAHVRDRLEAFKRGLGYAHAVLLDLELDTPEAVGPRWWWVDGNGWKVPRLGSGVRAGYRRAKSDAIRARERSSGSCGR